MVGGPRNSVFGSSRDSKINGSRDVGQRYLRKSGKGRKDKGADDGIKTQSKKEVLRILKLNHNKISQGPRFRKF